LRFLAAFSVAFFATASVAAAANFAASAALFAAFAFASAAFFGMRQVPRDADAHM
jgi:uncharacterized membrane protein